ncbi:MAG: carbamoyltransferase HypF [Desulforhopalus sp.]
MINSSTAPKRQGIEIVVRGTVQGVGFRPFIYNLASRFEISGTVSNTSEGVVIHATSQNDRLAAFVQAIEQESPPLARITSLESRPLMVSVPPDAFAILQSSSGEKANTAIPPDIALCEDCRRELLDPADRRFHYPFINCTNCGPRLTIVETIPYDRPATSMKNFSMCDSCSREYHDPANRRFHAQPNGCPDCGPSISLHDRQGRELGGEPALARTVAAFRDDLVVAMRGMGGFHLSVNGCSTGAVDKLRKRKNRPDKPLAIMVANSDRVRRLCHLSPEEEQLLLSAEHPILLLKKRPYTPLAENLAPGIGEIGVMLPYTPLHQLLFEQPGCPAALVMTSGNVSGMPICTTNDDALTRLEQIADLFLLHNREIVTRVDDSVVKKIGSQTVMLRRARGYVPAPTGIAVKLPQIIGCGAGLKNTFSLGREYDILVSQHIGDLDNLQSYEFFLESIDHLKRVFEIEPQVVACDLHPDYMSSRYAAELGLPLYKVQHHHAHSAAVMAEHHLDESVIAIILDGTGLGDDGTLWGGEVLQTDLTGYRRLGHFSCLRLPGGDTAATEPWRMAISGLFASYGEDGIKKKNLPRSLRLDEGTDLTVISSMLTNGFNSPLSSSCGRLFDCVAALLGVRQRISYEGQAAMELETLAQKALSPTWLQDVQESISKGCTGLAEKSGKWEIRSPELIRQVMDGISNNTPPAAIALQFHTTLISTLAHLTENISHQTGIRKVVLSGGCMQNSILLEGLFYALNSTQLQVFTGNSLPINDGAVSVGQAIIGGLRHVSRNSNEGDQRHG